MNNIFHEADNKAILHVMHPDKFIPSFIDFVEEHFDDFNQRHCFFIAGDNMRFSVLKRPNTIFTSDYGKYVGYVELAKRMNRADKILLHGLFNMQVVWLLALQPWLLKKCYWVIWGGDLYCYMLGKRNFSWYRNECIRRFVIKRLGHLVTYVEGDVDLARQWYGARGVYHECLMYTSNLYKEYAVPPKTESTINIQIGNSADPSNEHLEVLEILKSYIDRDIKIYAPLSYGNRSHAKRVAEVGKKFFGDKFIALTDFMPFDEYLGFLKKIDIAVFNHRRQQAMGNTLTLLGLGKKIFMRSDTTSFVFLKKIGAKVDVISNFNLSVNDSHNIANNKQAIANYCSTGRLLEQLKNIFNGN